MIHHSKVIRPLQFLVRHNTVYEKYATLVFDNLSWMNGAEEAELPGVQEVIDVEDKKSKETTESVSLQQTCGDGEYVQSFGVQTNDVIIPISEKDKDIIEKLQMAVREIEPHEKVRYKYIHI